MKRQTVGLLAFLLVLCPRAYTLGQERQPVALNEAVRQLEALPPDSPRRALDAAEVIARSLPPGDYATWSRLRPLLEDEAVHRQVRWVLFQAFIEAPDARMADEMLSMALRWSQANIEARAAHGPGEGWDRESDNRSSVALLHIFVARLGQPPLRELIGHREGALQLLRDAALGAAVTHDSRWDAILTLRDSPVSAERRGRVAAEIVVTMDRGGVSHKLLTMLQPSALPMLREHLAQSGNTRETIHIGALDAIAHLGDRNARPIIEAKMRAMAPTDPEAAQGMRHFLWKIDVQHPREGLLDHIKAPIDASAFDDRPWAVRRAAELGVTKEEIRQAILTHAESVAPVTVRDAAGRPLSTSRPLLPLKIAGIEVGALSADDLPDVSLPDPSTTSR